MMQSDITCLFGLICLIIYSIKQVLCLLSIQSFFRVLWWNSEKIKGEIVFTINNNKSCVLSAGKKGPTLTLLIHFLLVQTSKRCYKCNATLTSLFGAHTKYPKLIKFHWQRSRVSVIGTLWNYCFKHVWFLLNCICKHIFSTPAGTV